MIRTFKDKEPEKLFHRRKCETPQHLQGRATTRMRLMNAAQTEQDLRAVLGAH